MREPFLFGLKVDTGVPVILVMVFRKSCVQLEQFQDTALCLDYDQ